jgi:hypothetical protein
VICARSRRLSAAGALVATSPKSTAVRRPPGAPPCSATCPSASSAWQAWRCSCSRTRRSTWWSYRHVRRLPREGPVPLVEVTVEEESQSGAGNLAANLAALGTRVRFAGIVGRDHPAAFRSRRRCGSPPWAGRGRYSSGVAVSGPGHCADRAGAAYRPLREVVTVNDERPHQALPHCGDRIAGLLVQGVGAIVANGQEVRRADLRPNATGQLGAGGLAPPALGVRVEPTGHRPVAHHAVLAHGGPRAVGW